MDYCQGYVEFSCDLPLEILSFISSEQNFEKNGEFFSSCAIPNIYWTALEKSIPPQLRKDFKIINWRALRVTGGYEDLPRRDFDSLYTALYKGVSKVQIIAPTMGVVGHEICLGSVKDISKIPNYFDGSCGVDFDNPILSLHKTIYPKLGQGLLLDRLNPVWWRGTKKLISGTVTTITGYLIP